MENSVLTNLKVTEKGVSQFDHNFEYVYFVYNDKYTTCPYRIMNYLHIMA